MRYRPIDRDPEDPRLGRFIPDDWAHVEKYPLSALPKRRPTPRPVVIGVNWYTEFDKPGTRSAASTVRRFPGRPDPGPRRALRLSRARWRARHRGVVGLLRPGPGGRLRRLRLVAVHDDPQRGELYAARGCGTAQGDRRVAGDQPRRQQRDLGARRRRHPEDPGTSTGPSRTRTTTTPSAMTTRRPRQGHRALPLGPVGRRRAPRARQRRPTSSGGADPQLVGPQLPPPDLDAR